MPGTNSFKHCKDSVFNFLDTDKLIEFKVIMMKSVITWFIQLYDPPRAVLTGG